MCNRALQFWESAQNGAAILFYIERARPDCEPASPSTLCGLGQVIDRNVAWCRTALRTTPRQDVSRARVVCNDRPVGSGKAGRVAPPQIFWQKNIKMDVKTSFFDIMSEVPKDLQDVSSGIGQFLKNPTYKNFVWNLMSKLARSTLTSPSWIRVKIFIQCVPGQIHIITTMPLRPLAQWGLIG
jgi:hypothetical protein